jgi:hypothetical protein
MSITKSFYIIFMTIIFCTGVGIYHLSQNKSERKIASTSNGLKLTGKHLRPIDIRFTTLPSDIPSNPEREFTIEAKVILLQALNGELDYQWVLPPGVERVDGELSDTWTAVKQGDEITTKITVTGLNRDFNQIVVLEVSSLQNKSKIGSSGIFSSKPEDTEEALAPIRTKALQQHLTERENREISSQE